MDSRKRIEFAYVHLRVFARVIALANHLLFFVLEYHGRVRIFAGEKIAANNKN